MLALSRADVWAAVDANLALAAARAAFRAISGGQVVAPTRAHLELADGVGLVMPAYASETGALVTKVVCVHPGNPTRGLARVQGTVLLVDAGSGTPTALIEGTALTQIRTGAAIGLAADVLARSDASTIALFGAGATARTCLWAINGLRTIREVRVVNRLAERFDELERAMTDLLGDAAPRLRRVPTAAEALAGADIVVTATSSATPVVPGESLERGSFVGALGAFTPAMRELDTAAVVGSTVVVDQRSATLAEAGDLLIPIAEGAFDPDQIHAELGEILLGRRPGRTDPRETFVFKSVGNALQDLTLAQAIVERARERGLGTMLEL